MSDLNEYGIEDINMRANAITQADLKNVLLVWTFQFLVCFMTVNTTDIVLKSVYKQQLTREYGALRLVTMLVMHTNMVNEFD